MKKIYFVIVLFFIYGCGNNSEKAYTDTPTSGNVKIACDETMEPLAGAELDTFHGLYKYASITMFYLPEEALFKALINDSVKVIMSSRKLNDSENEYFKSRKLVPVTTKVAIDALAIIVNNKNPDSLFTVNDIRNILNGNYRTWKQINPATTLKNISFVFDNNGSSTYRYLRDSLGINGELPEWCFAARSNTDVIDYVEKNEDAIGVIGVSWISDEDDSKVRGFREAVKVAGIAESDSAATDDYYKPYQGYIAENKYPFIREIYTISREGRTGLGTGFVSFVASDAGQRIVRLNGLLPATMPVRLVKTY